MYFSYYYCLNHTAQTHTFTILNVRCLPNMNYQNKTTSRSSIFLGKVKMCYNRIMTLKFTIFRLLRLLLNSTTSEIAEIINCPVYYCVVSAQIRNVKKDEV